MIVEIVDHSAYPSLFRKIDAETSTVLFEGAVSDEESFDTGNPEGTAWMAPLFLNSPSRMKGVLYVVPASGPTADAATEYDLIADGGFDHYPLLYTGGGKGVFGRKAQIWALHDSEAHNALRMTWDGNTPVFSYMDADARLMGDGGAGVLVYSDGSERGMVRSGSTLYVSSPIDSVALTVEAEFTIAAAPAPGGFDSPEVEAAYCAVIAQVKYETSTLGTLQMASQGIWEFDSLMFPAGRFYTEQGRHMTVRAMENFIYAQSIKSEWDGDSDDYRYFTVNRKIHVSGDFTSWAIEEMPDRIEFPLWQYNVRSTGSASVIPVSALFWTGLHLSTQTE